MSKIICIYPDDSSTRSLNTIPYILKKNFPSIFHCYKIKPNDKSHEDCLKRTNSGSEEFVIFLGHGQSNKLFGAISKNTDVFSTEYTVQYKNDDFINKANIEVFKGKNVFCLSCYSNVNLGKWACEKGANSFIGFGNIPTDWEISYEKIFLSKKDFYLHRKLITEIILNTLLISIDEKYNMIKIVNLIKILTNNKIVELIKEDITHKWVINQLYSFKKEIVIFGNRFEKLS